MVFKGNSRFLFYILEIYILYAIQQTPEFNLFKNSCFWIVSGFVCISMFEKEFVSMAFGVLSGLLIDLSFGNFLGFNALILGLIGYLVGVIFSYYIKTNFISSMFISGFIAALVIFLNLWINFSALEFGNEYIRSNYFSIVLSSALATLPLYFLNRTISYTTREKVNEKIKY